MLERGVTVAYRTIRRWCLKFVQTYANSLRQRRPRPGDKWHLDEVPGTDHDCPVVHSCRGTRSLKFPL